MDNALYPPLSVHARRLKTDRRFIADGAEARFTGKTDGYYRFVLREQCADPERWARFAVQFRLRTDASDNAWRGEYWGKTMRGAAFVYSYNRDPGLYRTLCETVSDVLDSADETGAISSYTPDRFYEGWDLWCRKYVLLGLQYFLEICEDADLKDRCISAMETQVRLLMETFGPEPGKRVLTEATPIWRGLAASSILEPVVRLYDLTDCKDYLDFASYIVSLGGTSVADIYKIALQGDTPPYQFPMTKAYEMISCFEGLLEYYRATGDEDCKTAVLNFARLAAENEITVIGSAGCTHELFDHAKRRQTDTSCTDVMQETCVTVTWMKFCLQLLCLTGEPAWADRFEQSFYNAYLGAFNTERRRDASVFRRWPDAFPEPLPFISYAPLRPDIRGRSVGGLCLMADKHYYGCCAAIGGAGVGLLHKAAVTYMQNGVAVDLYLPGSVRLPLPGGGNVSLETETDYPVGDTVKLRVSPDAPSRFVLSLRIPGWSRKTALFVNGERFETEAGTYAEIDRVWTAGDTVELTFDMRVEVLRPEKWDRDLIVADYRWRHNYMVPRVISAPADVTRFIALRRGPLVLARDARFGGDPRRCVDVLTDEDGYAVAEPGKAPPFESLVSLSVSQTDGSAFAAVDYASAGKTMDTASLCGCWLPTDRSGAQAGR